MYLIQGQNTLECADLAIIWAQGVGGKGRLRMAWEDHMTSWANHMSVSSHVQKLYSNIRWTCCGWKVAPH